MDKEIPCKQCPVLAICVSKSNIKCDKLLTYAASYNYDIYPVKELPHLEFLETGSAPLIGYALKTNQIKGVHF